MRSEPCYEPAADVFDGWRDDVLSGRPPVLYPVGTGELQKIEIGPGLVSVFAAQPGAGKTLCVMQMVIDALRLTPNLKACVCNVEMAPETLLDRQLARLSGIDARIIRHRQLQAEHASAIERGLAELEKVLDRLCFVRPPFDLMNTALSAQEFGASLIVLDYIQRIPAGKQEESERASVNATMNLVRRLADRDRAVIVVSAVSRTKDKKGRTSYDGDGLNLASLRESSELEFGADDVFLLVPSENVVSLRHLKSRNGEARDLILSMDRKRQRFTVVAGDAPLDQQALEDKWKTCG